MNTSKRAEADPILKFIAPIRQSTTTTRREVTPPAPGRGRKHQSLALLLNLMVPIVSQTSIEWMRIGMVIAVFMNPCGIFCTAMNGLAVIREIHTAAPVRVGSILQIAQLLPERRPRCVILTADAWIPDTAGFLPTVPSKRSLTLTPRPCCWVDSPISRPNGRLEQRAETLPFTTRFRIRRCAISRHLLRKLRCALR